ncbi:LOW QUALITY PROTEIN: proopiomelanocortin b [Siphateles boraxobius]|uniref:LOW QUALITY PROTEIN: proopiomelanocortin b n=1 Tax=Siphateles boraxobius TaxID=180520 RepID=UPI004062BFC4
MLCSSWLVAASVLCFHSPYVDGRCLGLIHCLGLKSNEQKLQCVRQCRSAHESFNDGRVSVSEQLNAEEEFEEESLSLGQLLSALSPDSIRSGETPPRDERRSYSMEHFRWGKPMGRKRRPVKVFTNALEEEPVEPELLESVRVERGQGGTLNVQNRNNVKNNGKYRMTHFRWNAPRDRREDGGFVRPFPDQPSKPLLTLIRNIIVKDGQAVQRLREERKDRIFGVKTFKCVLNIP